MIYLSIYLYISTQKPAVLRMRLIHYRMLLLPFIYIDPETRPVPHEPHTLPHAHYRMLLLPFRVS
jgi:hypothetical protein